MFWHVVANFINPPPPFLRCYVKKMSGYSFICDSVTSQGRELMGELCKQRISGSPIDYVRHSLHTVTPEAHNLFKAEDTLIF